jgi:hypothetical protein
MKPWILNTDDRGTAYNNIWRLTPSGDLAFQPGQVGEVSTTDPVPTVSMPPYANSKRPVYDIVGNVVRSQICGTADNPFSTVEEDVNGTTITRYPALIIIETLKFA